MCWGEGVGGGMDVLGRGGCMCVCVCRLYFL